MKTQTRVMFRKYNNGEIVAVFPDIQEGRTKDDVRCYQHIGQHGQASYAYFIALTKPAKEHEYQELFKELIVVGYDDLKIIKRR